MRDYSNLSLITDDYVRKGQMMYGKIFASMYQGTLRGRKNEILVFTNMIASSDAKGWVDKHWRAIAEETGLTIDEVKEAIKYLEAPDAESRSIDHDGKRLLRIDEHREWGWIIVNYGKYRNIRDEETRRAQIREAQLRFRQKAGGSNQASSTVINRNHPSSSVITVSHGNPPSSKAEAEGEAEGEENKHCLLLDCEHFHGSVLDHPTFIDTWQRWEQFRREIRHKLTKTTVDQQIQKLKAFGLDGAIESINQSIAAGWQGLFEPKRQQKPKGNVI